MATYDTAGGGWWPPSAADSSSQEAGQEKLGDRRITHGFGSAAAIRQLDLPGACRLACRLLDEGLFERKVAVIIGWDLDLVRRAVADRSRGWNGRAS